MMQTLYSLQIGSYRKQRSQRGQTIVVALLVLLLLGFVAALFVTIVTRNLHNASRANRVLNADYYAQAGLRFADEQLTTRPEGADWRPALQYLVATQYLPPKGSREDGRYDNYIQLLLNQGRPLAAADASDPDKAFLDQGFSRYNIGGGRYLIRVSYDPIGEINTAAKLGQPVTSLNARYLKIESVGRVGTVDPTDPTTFSHAPPTLLSSTLAAYKPIGITDYARFETNVDQRSGTMDLGVASTYDAALNEIVTPGVFDFSGPNALTQYPIITRYGAPDAYLLSTTTPNFLIPNPNAGNDDLSNPPTGFSYQAGGGSMRANGTLRFYGENFLYLNTGQTGPSFNDKVEVAGNILMDSYLPQPPGTNPNDPLDTQATALILNPTNPTAPTTTGTYLYPSNDIDPTTNQPRFNTQNGAVRDGGSGPSQTDVNGNARDVNRLDPPLLDSVNTATSLNRYQELTKNSPPRLDPTSSSTPGNPATLKPYPASASQYGYGQAIYVDNVNDKQGESTNLLSGASLVDEWLNRTPAASKAPGTKQGWQGDFYNPPGTVVDLGFQRREETDPSGNPRTDGSGNPIYQTFYGVRLSRSDVDNNGNPVLWKDPQNVTDSLGSTMIASYTELGASNDPLTESAATLNSSNPDNDVTIYAEGNVRVHGSVSADANDSGTNSGFGQASDEGATKDRLPRHITIVSNGTAYIDGNLLRGNPDSTITVLAHDYVCVNTTQFYAGPQTDETPAGVEVPQPYTGDPALQALELNNEETLIQDFNFGLASTQTPSGNYPGTSTLALYVSVAPSSSGTTQADFDFIDPRTGYSVNTTNLPFQTPILSPIITSSGTGTAALTRTSYDLSATVLAGVLPTQNVDLEVRHDPGSEGGTATQPVELERVAIFPQDIRIEALLYAQTKSFFVIPGPWFNSSSDDTLDKYVAATNLTAAKNPARPTLNADDPNQARFPFYGQPSDLRITIDGAVSEARPADISAQSSWMAKWGWIPQYHGSALPGIFSATGETAGHVSMSGGSPTNTPAIGLSIIYNPQAAYPYKFSTTTGQYYLRTDLFGRPLPFAPNLPVSTGLLYAGQSSDQPALQ